MIKLESENLKMLVVYNRLSGFDCIFNYETLAVSFDDIEETKKRLQQDYKLWINRYNELDEKTKSERWGLQCLNYAKQDEHAINTLRIIKKSDYLKEAQKTTLTEAEEITEELYDDMLCCLPPCYKNGLNGFYMSEFLTDSFTSQFFKKDGKFYHKIIDIKDPTTWN